MIFLVTGGAASGKSAFAETLACRLACHENAVPIYLAAMQAADDSETIARIRRHRAQRAGKGFCTVERSRAFSQLELPHKGVVLLECLTTLAANELFAEEGISQEDAFRAICDGLCHVARQSVHVVVVSGDVFADGCVYSPETEKYRRLLARLHAWLAPRCYLYEIVCGLVGAPPVRGDKVELPWVENVGERENL